MGEKNNLKSKIVSQDSELGNLGLLSLLDKGFCGPPYDLSGCSVSFYRIGEGIDVSFYDMSCGVYPGDKYYDEIIEYFKGDDKNDVL